jgi:DNA-binding MarR family transcriptional regulator
METDADALLERLFRLEWLLRFHYMRNYRDRGPMADLHRGQGRILALLKLKPDISQKELASILDIRAQSLGELLAKLEKAGYVSRTPNEADHRVMDLHLTEAGRSAAETEAEDDSLEDIVGTLSDEERSTLRSVLDILIERLEAKLGDLRRPGPDEGGRFDGWDRMGRGPWTRGPRGPRSPRDGFPPRESFD